MIAFAKHEARIERLESRISATEDERDALLKSVDLMTEITRESMGEARELRHANHARHWY